MLWGCEDDDGGGGSACVSYRLVRLCPRMVSPCHQPADAHICLCEKVRLSGVSSSFLRDVDDVNQLRKPEVVRGCGGRGGEERRAGYSYPARDWILTMMKQVKVISICQFSQPQAVYLQQLPPWGGYRSAWWWHRHQLLCLYLDDLLSCQL